MPTIIQDASSSGAALDTIQTISAAVSTPILAWGSVATVVYTAAGLTTTLPDITAGDVGKRITIFNNGANSFLLAIGVGTISSTNGLQVGPGSSVTISAVSTTSAILVSTNGQSPVVNSFLFARQVGNNAAFTSGNHFRFDTVVDSAGNNISLDTASTYSSGTNTASIGRFLLRPGKYLLQGTVGTWNSSSGFMRGSWFNSDTNTQIVPNVADFASSPDLVNSNIFANGTNPVINVTTPTRVEYRMLSPIGITSYSINDTNGVPTAFILQLSGGASISGYTQDYALLNDRTTQTLAVNGDIAWANNQSGAVATGALTYSANVISGFQIGRQYLLEANFALNSTTGADNANIGFYSPGNTQIGPTFTISNGTPGTGSRNDQIKWVFVPTAATGTAVKIRCSALGGAGVSLNNPSSSGASYWKVSQIDGTPVSGSVLPKVTTILSSQTFTPDPRMKYLEVEMVGGGGSGGYGFGATAANNVFLGLGGNSGAFVKVRLTAAQVGASQVVTIGAGGTAGGAGGTSSFGALCSANGGASGFTNYVSADGSLGSVSLVNNSVPATFTISTGTDIGSKTGLTASTAAASLVPGSFAVITLSDGAASEMGPGAQAFKITTAGRRFIGVSIATASAYPAGANTGGGASGDASFSTTAGSGAATTQANGGSGKCRVTEYF